MTRTTTFLIEPTETTPFIEFDYSLGKLDIIGKKIPKSYPEFYRQLNEKLSGYLSEDQQSLSVNISLEEVDFTSNNQFMDLLGTLKDYQKTNRDVQVKWYYVEHEGHPLESLKTHMNSLGIDCHLRSYGV